MQDYLAGVLAFCDGLRAQTGWHPALLDIGGSLACPTVEAIPRRQFRLNRAIGADLTPPDPGDTLGLGEAIAGSPGKWRPSISDDEDFPRPE